MDFIIQYEVDTRLLCIQCQCWPSLVPPRRLGHPYTACTHARIHIHERIHIHKNQTFTRKYARALARTETARTRTRKRHNDMHRQISTHKQARTSCFVRTPSSPHPVVCSVPRVCVGGPGVHSRLLTDRGQVARGNSTALLCRLGRGWEQFHTPRLKWLGKWLETALEAYIY